MEDRIPGGFDARHESPRIEADVFAGGGLIFGDTALKAKSWSMSGPAHRSVLKAWNSETLAVAAEAVKKMKGATVLP